MDVGKPEEEEEDGEKQYKEEGAGGVDEKQVRWSRRPTSVREGGEGRRRPSEKNDEPEFK